jgi:hypothetical protein
MDTTKLDKEVVFNTIRDMVTDFLYHNRKKDEDLPVGAVEAMLDDKIITIDEIVGCFALKMISVLHKKNV